MLSLDKTLLGEQVKGKFGVQGDTIARHRKYGEMVDKLDIIVTSPPGFSHVRLACNIDVYPTNCRFKISHLNRMFKYAENIIDHDGVDVVVSQDVTSPVALKIKNKFNIPYVVTFHASGFDAPEMKSSIMMNMLLPFVKYSVRRADGLRVVSSEVKKYFVNNGFSGVIDVIPTASDHSVFSKEDIVRLNLLRKKYAGKRIILANGRLVSVKNYPLLFDVMQRVKEKYDNVLLLIIGSGDMKSDLVSRVKKMRLTDCIEFLGGMKYENMVPYYQLCDVFAHSSDSESLGKVLLHAGSAGKPVVATDTRGARSIIRNGKTGFLVKVGDADEFSEKLITLLGDRELCDRMGVAARKTVLSIYDSEINTKKFVSLWRRVSGA